MSLTALIAWLSAKGPLAWAAAAVAGYLAWKAYKERVVRTDDPDTVDYHLRELAKAAAVRESQSLVDFVNGFQAEYRKVKKS